MKLKDLFEMKKARLVIAREIIVLFGGLIMIGVLWGGLHLRNSWYSNKIVSHSEEVIRLTNELDSLPKDYIKEFYDQTARYFVVNYKLGQDSYAIPKEKEQKFLNRFLDSKPAPVLLPIYPKGYSYFKSPDPLNILEEDSFVVFDYVKIEEFQQFVASDDYIEKLFLTFDNNPNSQEIDWNAPLDGIRQSANGNPPVFDPMKPYTGIFELGTVSEFKSKMLKGLLYTDKIADEKKELEARLDGAKNTMLQSKSSILSSNAILKLIYKSLLVICILLYPVRFSILLLLWAFRVVKEK